MFVLYCTNAKYYVQRIFVMWFQGHPHHCSTFILLFCITIDIARLEFEKNIEAQQNITINKRKVNRTNIRDNFHIPCSKFVRSDILRILYHIGTNVLGICLFHYHLEILRYLQYAPGKYCFIHRYYYCHSIFEYLHRLANVPQIGREFSQCHLYSIL